MSTATTDGMVEVERSFFQLCRDAGLYDDTQRVRYHFEVHTPKDEPLYFVSTWLWWLINTRSHKAVTGDVRLLLPWLRQVKPHRDALRAAHRLGSGNAVAAAARTLGLL